MQHVLRESRSSWQRESYAIDLRWWGEIPVESHFEYVDIYTGARYVRSGSE
jgi:hypothetical protein